MLKKTYRPDVFAGFLFFFLMILNYGMKSSAMVYPEIINDGMLILMLLFALISLYLHRYQLRTVILLVMVLGVGLLNYLLCRMTDFFLIVLGVVVASYLPVKDLLKLFFWEKLAIFCTVVLLSVLGCFPILVERVWKGGYYVSAYSFGFEAGNRLSLHAFVLVMLFNLVYLKEKYRGWAFIPELLLVLGLFQLTQSRAGLLFGLLGVFLMTIGGRIGFVRKTILRWPRVLLVLVIALAYGLIYAVTKSDQIRQMDISLFNNRLKLAANYFVAYDISLLGQTLDMAIIDNVSNHYTVLDSGYGYSLIYYGLIPVAAMFGLLYAGAGRLKKEGKYLEIVSILLLLAWSMYEGAALTFETNFTFLFAGLALRAAKDTEKTENGGEKQ